ncbi:hypothetical protein BC826DRAFT_973915 [Russula brevipes]|nr:hypothetical protein BC826DRAFT_973915 [Russula brevipes]
MTSPWLTRTSSVLHADGVQCALDVYPEVLPANHRGTGNGLAATVNDVFGILIVFILLVPVHTATNVVLEKVDRGLPLILGWNPGHMANEEARLASSEASKEADLAIDNAKQVLCLANESVEKFMADYDALKRSQCMKFPPVAITKRTNDLAALDTPVNNTGPPRCLKAPASHLNTE